MAVDHPNIAHRDWRVRAITTTTQPWQSSSGLWLPAGMPVHWLGYAHLEEGGELGVSFPDPAAIYLSLANKELRKAMEYQENVLPTVILPPPQSGGVRTIDDSAETGFFDCLESLIAGVVFSYSALEVFANYMIPDDYSYSAERGDKRCTEVYAKKQIERNLSLDTKLDKVLPRICGVQSPKGTQKWERFVKLQSLRDRLIHLKTSDWEASKLESAKEYIWSSLLSKETLQVSSSAFDMICHYLPPEKARWVQRYQKLSVM